MNGSFVVDDDTFVVVRRRLAVDLHRVAYHDAGAEVSPGRSGTELDQPWRVGTPHCKKGDRELAVLGRNASWAVPGSRYESWPAFRRAAFAALGVARWRTREHKGCFHRRGKARHDLAFAVAVALVTTGDDDGARFWAVDGGSRADEPYLTLTERAEAPVPRGVPARHLAVTCCGRPLAVLRSDGFAVTGNGPLALDDHWWAGDDAEAIATAVRTHGRHIH